MEINLCNFLGVGIGKKISYAKWCRYFSLTHTNSSKIPYFTSKIACPCVGTNWKTDKNAETIDTRDTCKNESIYNTREFYTH